MGNYYNNSKGIGNVGSYQSSGIPYATSSIAVAALGDTPTVVEFPYVTKFVTISNTNTGANVPLRFGFSRLGITGSASGEGGAEDYYFVLDNGDSYTGEFRVTDLHLLTDTIGVSGSAAIIAGVTTIARTQLGHNWSGSVGVG